MRKSKKCYSSSSSDYSDTDSDCSESDSFEMEYGSLGNLKSESNRKIDVTAQPEQEDRIMKTDDSIKPDFKVNTIPVRQRDSEKKWMLDYSDYAIVSKYIHDIESSVSFQRVSTRTNCIFSMPSNMNINVTDPACWEKLNTHIIHTDIAQGITDFMDSAPTHRLFGNHLSFQRYLNREVILYKNNGMFYKIISIKGDIPHDLYMLLAEYIRYSCLKNTKDRIAVTGNYQEFFQRRSTLEYVKNLFASSKHYVSDNFFQKMIALCTSPSGCSLYISNLEMLIKIILEDKKFMDKHSSRHDITIAFRTESYITIGNIDIPMYNHTQEHIDCPLIKPLFANSKLLRKYAIQTPLEEILYNMVYADVMQSYNDPKALVEYGLAAVPDHTIVVVQVESFIDKRDYYRKIGVSKKPKCIRHGKYTVVYMPIVLFNFFQIAHTDDIEPITNDHYYIKGTSIICTYNKINCMEKKGVIGLCSYIGFSTQFDLAECPFIKRFVVNVESYSLDDPLLLLPTEFATDSALGRPFNFMALKYGYNAPMNSTNIPEKFYYSDKYGIENRDIRDLVIERPLCTVIVPFHIKCVINTDAFNNILISYLKEDRELEETDLMFYSHGRLVPFPKYIEHKKRCAPAERARLDEILTKMRNIRLIYNRWYGIHDERDKEDSEMNSFIRELGK